MAPQEMSEIDDQPESEIPDATNWRRVYLLVIIWLIAFCVFMYYFRSITE